MIKKVAIIGTQGIPANYGGFESLVENIVGVNCSPSVEYTVFCSGLDKDPSLKEYKGCHLKYVSLHANGIQSIPYDIISMLKSLKGYDAMLILGTSGCMFIPFLRFLTKTKTIVNVDGIEHMRAKWGKIARWVLRISEKSAIRWADVVVADNDGIKEYVKRTYGKEAVVIAYGGDHAVRDVSPSEETRILNSYGVTSGSYGITVSRIEPENNIHITLEAFRRTKKPLIYIGNWDHSPYSQKLKEKYANDDNIHLVDALYDLDALYVLRKNSRYYIHGHSAGGTNPSLVEAMTIGCNILAFDVVYNRHTTHNKARYYTDVESLIALLESDQGDILTLQSIACEHYSWPIIARQYEALY